jgi:hypothetical protein
VVAVPALLALAICFSVLAIAALLLRYWSLEPVKFQRRAGAALSFVYHFFRKIVGITIGTSIAVGILICFIPVTVVLLPLLALRGERPRLVVNITREA